MSEQPKDGDILEVIDKTAKKLDSEKENQRQLIHIINTLRLIKNVDQHPILHVCAKCKKQTMENAKNKAKELGVDIDTNQTVNLTENLNMDSS